MTQLVSVRARTHGSTIAIDVFDRGERATYSEMDRRSNSYAHALRGFGVRKGDRVGVMLPNRIEFPILWFALAKLGAVMVPIYLYTPREVEYIFSDTQAKFAVVDETAWPVFSAMDPWPEDLAKERVIVVGQPSATATTLDDLLKNVDDSPIDENVRPDDLLNIQSTSGTTGFPKGVMLTHDYWAIVSYVLSNLSPYKRYLCWSPFHNVYGQWLLLTSYQKGGTLYLASEMDSSRLIGWIKTYRIECCTLPGLIAEAAADVPRWLRQVAQTQRCWSAETVRRFREEFGVRGLNYFGMTEIGCATYPEIEEMDESGSVGIRSPFRELRLVNDDGTPTPVGEVGELWVRGRGILKGYWNRPRANAECFEGEWFKTGDLLRSDEHGFYWFVGRKKDVIRRLDENIAAREVEAIVCEIPAIADVAAVPVRDDKKGEEIKIYVELKEGVRRDDLLVERILDHARARLAVFKVPRYIAFSPALPRTVSSNKVLKRELMDVSDPIAGAYDSEQKRWR
ncbi:class I adenylate-forming enzyme family protein [Bradyrhizobium sp. SRL28]|uniref:class I adenylate-forming enzyme family protein n=1 Tax=Bradyrhizobium sp. SRL28 TaxID=2836178 RepID=UPI0027E03F22|nr:class I adenylate-forming enzyme family protein [Bradyrhizobium sp. SRL28]